MMWLNRRYRLAYAFALLLLAGCASLGLAKPQTFEEKVAYAITTNTAIRDSSTNALNAHQISSADATQVLALNDQARALIDSARSVYSTGDVEGANHKLALGLAVLAQLQAYLNSRGVK